MMFPHIVRHAVGPHGFARGTELHHRARFQILQNLYDELIREEGKVPSIGFDVCLGGEGIPGRLDTERVRRNGISAFTLFGITVAMTGLHSSSPILPVFSGHTQGF